MYWGRWQPLARIRSAASAGSATAGRPARRATFASDKSLGGAISHIPDRPRARDSLVRETREEEGTTVTYRSVDLWNIRVVKEAAAEEEEREGEGDGEREGKREGEEEMADSRSKHSLLLSPFSSLQISPTKSPNTSSVTPTSLTTKTLSYRHSSTPLPSSSKEAPLSTISRAT